MTLKYLVVLLLLIVLSAVCITGLISEGVNLNSQKLSLRNNATSHTYNQSINAIEGSENEEDITDFSEGESNEDETHVNEQITENLGLGMGKTTQDENHNNELSLLVMGDFGYTDKDKPNAEQRRLGELVANRVANSQTKYDFMLSVGDNVYPLGLESFEDKKADVIFEDTFQMSALGLDWYSVLGNHDLIGDMEAALRLSERFPLWKQTEPYYYETFNIGNSHLKAAFVFMHSPDLVCRNRSTFECYKNIQKNIKFDQIQTQIDWLNDTLSSLSSDSEIVWKIVVIHNAVFSAGKKHGDDKDIKELVLPLLVEYKVDVVLSGHDHSVQYLRMEMQNNNKEESGSNIEKKEDNKDDCPNEPDYDYCSKNEFFYYELTKCGEIKKLEKNNYIKSAFYDNNEQVLNILDSKYSRLSTANQEEYLHQFVMGNGGIKHEELCPVKQMKSEGKLRYGHTVSGIGEIRIKEDKLDVSLISVDNELLYSLSIFRSDVNTVKQI